MKRISRSEYRRAAIWRKSCTSLKLKAPKRRR